MATRSTSVPPSQDPAALVSSAAGAPTGPGGRAEARSSHALRLIADGKVASRAELRAALGVSASTASSLVKRLLESGSIVEKGDGPSTGGRRPTLLQVAPSLGSAWAVAELGGRHLRYGLVAPTGDVVAVEEIAIDVASTPTTVIETLAERWLALAGAVDPPARILAGAVGLPGPVDSLSGELVGPARMPGWNEIKVGEELAARLGVPVAAENDARAAALGEASAHAGDVQDLIYVKAGTGIGGGLVVGGSLVRGGGGRAGDITHVHVEGAEGLICSCGREGCLETVASGAAIRRRLDEAGLPTESMADVVQLANAFNPEATSAIRTSGTRLGTALAPLVTFLNPSAVLIGGILSSLDAYVAAVRSAIYDSSLAMTTQNLLIERSSTGADAALLGLARIAQGLVPLPVGSGPS